MLHWVGSRTAAGGETHWRYALITPPRVTNVGPPVMLPGARRRHREARSRTPVSIIIYQRRIYKVAE